MDRQSRNITINFQSFLFKPFVIKSSWLINLLSLILLTKMLLEKIFSTGVYLKSETECPAPWIPHWGTGALMTQLYHCISVFSKPLLCSLPCLTHILFPVWTSLRSLITCNHVQKVRALACQVTLDC